MKVCGKLLQEKLGQLQALVVQLLGERHLLPDGYTGRLQKVINGDMDPKLISGDLNNSHVEGKCFSLRFSNKNMKFLNEN